ncbi:MAG: hypothetical protein QOE70_362 [Chthoniobacter sp.]|jgi:hypothetical protein|nr:hypothetical protein [Chthoniobacter sp.]
MKTVKTFGNLAEAGFACSLLEAAGVPATLADEQSFLMLPGLASGGIRLQVEDAEFDRAFQILAQGPQGEAASAGASTPTPAGAELRDSTEGKIPVGLFVAGAAVLALMALAVRHAFEIRRNPPPRGDQTYEKDEFDYNHDGRPDHFGIYRRGRLISATADNNFDGRIDEWTFFDAEGRTERAELDTNFDGRPDEWLIYRNGVVQTVTRDTDFNGRTDWVGTYVNGVIAHAEWVPNESGIVTRKEIYEHGVLREEWVDDNLDGTFDYKILHDPLGNTSERLPAR